MMTSEFWLICPTQYTSAEESSTVGSKFPGIHIVELTQDELVYIWPVKPKFDSLCLVCKNYRLKDSQICSSLVPAGYPCRFDAVPEAEVTQDFDDFIIDGEYLDLCGYFYSFTDFKRQNGYSPEDYLFFKLGSFPSIRGARAVLHQVSQFLSELQQ